MSKDKFKSNAPLPPFNEPNVGKLVEPSPLANNEGIVDDHGETNAKKPGPVLNDDIKVADPVQAQQQMDEATAQGVVFQAKNALMMGLQSNRGESRIPREIVERALNILGVRDSDFPT